MLQPSKGMAGVDESLKSRGTFETLQNLIRNLIGENLLSKNFSFWPISGSKTKDFAFLQASERFFPYKSHPNPNPNPGNADAVQRRALL